MTISPATALKWSGLACAVLWSGGMTWWIGSFDLPTILIFSIGGVLFGLSWYVAMRFIFDGLGPREQRASGGVAWPRSRRYVWLGWAGMVALTGGLTSLLLGLVNPLLPSGDWHWLIKSLLIIAIWPGLMWSLRPLMKRHLPLCDL